MKECDNLNINEVSKKYDISINNIYRWCKRCERRYRVVCRVHDRKMEYELLT
jgi:transposase